MDYLKLSLYLLGNKQKEWQPLPSHWTDYIHAGGIFPLGFECFFVLFMQCTSAFALHNTNLLIFAFLSFGLYSPFTSDHANSNTWLIPTFSSGSCCSELSLLLPTESDYYRVWGFHNGEGEICQTYCLLIIMVLPWPLCRLICPADRTLSLDVYLVTCFPWSLSSNITSLPRPTLSYLVLTAS